MMGTGEGGKKSQVDVSNRIVVIGRNRKAEHHFQIVQRWETGIVLTGSEVKSLRAGRVGFEDAYAVVKDGEIYLRSLHIPPYEKASLGQRNPKADRKLLLKHSEIQRIAQKVKEKGFTLIPLSLYFKNRWVKVELGLAKGKKEYDKREAIRKREEKRELERFHRIKQKWTGERSLERSSNRRTSRT